MKHPERFLSRSSLIANARVLFFVLTAMLVSILIFAYTSRAEIMQLTKRSHIAHELSATALFLSEENYHTQLELYELYAAPNDERVRDFLYHEQLFLKSLKDAYQLFWIHRENVSDDVKEEIEEINNAVPVLRSKWKFIMKTIVDKKGPAQTRTAMEELEDLFDELRFNERIKYIADMQMVTVHQTEERIKSVDSLYNKVMGLGVVLGILLSLVVSVLHKAALEGKVHQFQLAQASKLASIGELSAGVAHELNNPLMIVKGFNDRVAKSLEKTQVPKDSPVWDYVTEIRSGCERMKKIIQHFRDFSRMETQETHAVNVNEVVQKSFSFFDEQLKFRNIEVSFDLSHEQPHIDGNENRLEQVFVNLINNSRDALDGLDPSRSRKIHVQTRIEGKNVVVEFSDNGPGIPIEEKDRVFDPFFTTKPVGKGTGLGLSISQGIIRDHQGLIEVSSKKNEGVQFKIVLPLKSLDLSYNSKSHAA